MLSEFRHAVRSIWKDRMVSLLVIVTMMVAIGANSMMFSIVNGVLLRPLPYPQPDRLIFLWENNMDRDLPNSSVSAATYLDWRDRSKSLEGIAAYRYRGNVLDQDGEPERVVSIEMSPRTFQVLGSRVHLGRSFEEADEKPGQGAIALLSFGTWQRRFGGDPGILNSVLRLDGVPHTVVGVMNSEFVFPPGDPEVELWLPLTLDLEALPSRPHRMYNTIARLAPGVTLAQARQEMSLLAQEIAEENPTSNQGWGITARPVLESLIGDLKTILLLLLASVGIVLLIGCANVANLLLAKSLRVQRDFAVRAALGASRNQLLRRSLLENLLLTLTGAILGLGLAWAGLPWALRLLPQGVPRVEEIQIDSMVLLFTLSVSVFAGLAIGLLPAIRVLRSNLVEVLQESTRGAVLSARGRRVSQGLVCAEVLLAFLLLAGAGLLVRSFLSLLEVDPGFRKDSVVAVALSLPRARYTSQQQKQFVNELLPLIQQLRSTNAAGIVSALPLSPLGTEFDMPFSYPGLEVASPSERPTAKYRAATKGYLKAIGIPLLKGRGFDSFDREDGRKVTLINQMMADKYFSDRDPVGQVLQMPMVGETEVVGIVGNVRHYGLESDVQPEVFVPFAQLALTDLHVVASTPLRDGSQAVAEIRQAILTIDPELPITRVLTAEGLLADSVAARRVNAVVMLSMALIAAFLAALGIYGVISYLVAQRVSELGLRMAIGAHASDIAWLVLRQVLVLVAGATMVGLLVAQLGGRLIQQQLFAVRPSDPVTYIVVTLGILLLGLLAAGLPALRASRIDPADALRAR